MRRSASLGAEGATVKAAGAASSSDPAPSRGTPRFHPLPASEGDRGANPLPCPPSPLRIAADVSSASQGGRLHGRRVVGIAGVVGAQAADVSSASPLSASLRQTCRRHRRNHRTGRGRSRGWPPYRERKRHPPTGWHRVAVLPLRDLRSYSLRSSGRLARGASLRRRRPIRAGRPQGTGWSGVHRKLAPGRAAGVSPASPFCPVGLSWVCQRTASIIAETGSPVKLNLTKSVTSEGKNVFLPHCHTTTLVSRGRGKDDEGEGPEGKRWKEPGSPAVWQGWPVGDEGVQGDRLHLPPHLWQRDAATTAVFM